MDCRWRSASCGFTPATPTAPDITGLAFPPTSWSGWRPRPAVILDVFRGGQALVAADLRRLLKETQGAHKEIEPHHYGAVGNRDVLIRLQNNIKLRAIAANDLERGLAVLRTMTLIAPDRGGCGGRRRCCRAGSAT
ncbi:MAG: hypothetical protein IPK78_19725 [Rhodospirillales bacterium]|nr:hypothetical protein [Rhodospirillales bacterium]